jgi:hypothetical protein
MSLPATHVQPVHFEDFGGLQFERLVFAYHARLSKWRTLEWYGQTGSDSGRDIWGVCEDGTPTGESICVQCVNRGRLAFAKAARDIAKVMKAGHGVPQRFRIVTRSNVSAAMRNKIKNHLQSCGVIHSDVWSGAEFEEFLRRDAESLLRRFVGGDVFPDAAPDLLIFAHTDAPMSDDDALAIMARLFDRPAFYTPMHAESNLGDFKQAITDTIQALGTGIWKARDGQVIARIPSRHQLEDDSLRSKVQAVEKALARLRAGFDDLLGAGIVQHCGCNTPACSLYFHAAPSCARIGATSFGGAGPVPCRAPSVRGTNVVRILVRLSLDAAPAFR